MSNGYVSWHLVVLQFSEFENLLTGTSSRFKPRSKLALAYQSICLQIPRMMLTSPARI